MYFVVLYALTCLQPWLTPWLHVWEWPWVRGTQLNCDIFTDRKKLWDNSCWVWVCLLFLFWYAEGQAGILVPQSEWVKLLSCVRLYDPMDCSPPGSSVHGILQARILEWVAIVPQPGIKNRPLQLKRGFLTTEPPKKVKVKSLSHVRLFATKWTLAYQAPPSMGFSRQEYWSGLPFPSRDHPDSGIELGSPTLWADALTSEPPGKPN